MSDFIRYLAAKQTVDDRALNAHVYETLRAALPPGPLDVLEVGAGTGAMLDRLARRGLFAAGGRYTAVDADPANVAAGVARYSGAPLPVAVAWAAADVYDFARRERGRRVWDLLIAHAFLDLVDAPRLLPELLALLRPGGLFYFTINFDGLTILEPPVDPGFDEQVIALYHQTMDERTAAGRPAGDSHSGRHLLWQLPAAGGEILAAGASDWVVVPSRGGYVADEAEFLRAILGFFEASLSGRPELDPARLAEWLARRRAQIEAGELIYVAHQMDVCGRAGEPR
jgi:SAM-dependent methyltransferase